MPRIPKDCYWLTDKAIAFVPHPEERGRWLRTHPCVLLAECPHCGAKPGFPCHGRTGRWHGDTHALRRKKAKPLMLAYTQREPHIVVERARIPVGKDD